MPLFVVEIFCKNLIKCNFRHFMNAATYKDFNISGDIANKKGLLRTGDLLIFRLMIS